MKLLKPYWVHHDDQPIFSIDVHPDGSRFVTGGQGQDSGKIVIWNMGPVVDKKQEKDENIPKVLCQMDHHIACVNVVRWSNNGLFLASGSDDKLIMIWQYVHGGNLQNIENWKCGFTLRGHSGDILDLAWSAKDQYLASCSVDNTVIIWNALKFPDIISRINAHAGLVKGVAWDPVGTYFASQSDDKSLKIWKTLDWSLEKSIEEPFKECCGTTHILRLNWSPDGQVVISAHAINNSVPTAQVIDRNKWSTKIDFVGHRKAVTTVRFYPQILKPYDAEKTNFKTHCLCALGSRDRSVSIWLTQYSRPICVIHDVFDNPIMDLSWCKSPKPGLIACSMDGSICYIEFEYKEVGRPLTREETEEFFMKKYNHDLNATIVLKTSNQQTNLDNSFSKKNEANSQSNKLIENLDILLAQEQKQQHQIQSSNENTMTNNNYKSLTNTPSKLQMLTENHKQIERRMPDGRRRITPICVAKPGDFDTPLPFSSQSFNNQGFTSVLGFVSDISITSKTATEHSKIIVEKRDEKNEIVEISPVKSIVYSKPTSYSLNINQNSNSCDATKLLPPSNGVSTNKIATITTLATTNSISEVTPMDTSTVPAISALKETKLSESVTKAQKHNKEETASSQSSTKPIEPTSKSNKSTTSSLKSSQNEQNKPTAFSTPNNTKQTQKQQTSVASKPTTAPNSTQNVNSQQVNGINLANSTTNNDFNRIAAKINTPQKSHSDHNLISNVDHQFHFLKQIDVISDKNFIKILKREKPTETIKVHNSIPIIDRISSIPTSNATYSSQANDTDSTINCIRLYKDDKLKWQVYFNSPICEVVGNSNIIACVCEESTLNLFKTLNGTQLCCPIVLDSRAASLKFNSNYFMCLTTNGFLYTWKYNLEQNSQESLLNNISNKNKQNTNDINQFNLTTIIHYESCQFILRNGDWLDCNLTENGVPVINMSKNRSYFYSLQTKCWHIIPSLGSNIGEESKFLFNSNSIFGNNFKSSNQHLNGPLSQIQSRNKSSSIIKTIELMNKVSSNKGNLNAMVSKQDFTLTHLESQVNAALGLNSSKEYKFWLMTLVRYIVENNYEDKLTELCNFLLGPLYSTNWNPIILTHKKRDLLKEILPIIALNLNFQRLFSYYKQQLNLITDLDTKSSVLDRLVSSNRQEFNREPIRSTNMSNIRSLSVPKSQITNNTTRPESPMQISIELSKNTDESSKLIENLAVEQEKLTSEDIVLEVEKKIQTISEENQINNQILEKEEKLDDKINEILVITKQIEEEPEEVCMVEQIENNENKNEQVFKIPEFPVKEEQQIIQNNSTVVAEIARMGENSKEIESFIKESDAKGLNEDIETANNKIENGPSSDAKNPASSVGEILMIKVEQLFN